jgi:hypothetical protein
MTCGARKLRFLAAFAGQAGDFGAEGVYDFGAAVDLAHS